MRFNLLFVFGMLVLTLSGWLASASTPVPSSLPSIDSGQAPLAGSGQGPKVSTPSPELLVTSVPEGQSP
jgi:hypothetical protein